MNISEEITKLKEERLLLEGKIAIAHNRIIEINAKIRSIESVEKARIKKLSKILGEGQKGVAE